MEVVYRPSLVRSKPQAELERLVLLQLISLWYCDRAGIARIRHKAAQQAQELSKIHPFNLLNLQAAFSLITFLECYLTNGNTRRMFLTWMRKSQLMFSAFFLFVCLFFLLPSSSLTSLTLPNNPPFQLASAINETKFRLIFTLLPH